MRICRFLNQGKPATGFYDEDRIVPIAVAAAEFQKATQEQVDLPAGDDLLPLLPHGACHAVTKKLHAWIAENGALVPESATLPTDTVDLLVPIPRPNKLLLLAGNYAKHIEEGGGVASDRTETFPYVFMKPPTTTLTDPCNPIKIPSVSPDHIDWEIELAVVIGRLAKGIKESEALDYVAGYLVVNDISNREFHPNPNRQKREKDSFFDWLHGKWHDSFCPCGPCVTAADAIADPQQLDLKLHVNGEIQQDSNTANQIFPVAAVIEFISSFVTLEPGDIISTGTSAGVGNAKGLYLRGGDTIQASIQSIGSLVTRVENE